MIFPSGSACSNVSGSSVDLPAPGAAVTMTAVEERSVSFSVPAIAATGSRPSSCSSRSVIYKSHGVFLCHATVEGLLVGGSDGDDGRQLPLELEEVARGTVAFLLAGSQAALKLVGGTTVVVTDEEACEGEPVGGAEPLLPLVEYGATEECGLGAGGVGEGGKLGIEVAVVVATEEVAIDVGSLPVVARKVEGHGGVATGVLVAQTAARGFLQEGHEELRMVGIGVLLQLVEGEGDDALGGGGQRVGTILAAGGGLRHGALPVGIGKAVDTILLHELQHAEGREDLLEPQGIVEHGLVHLVVLVVDGGCHPEQSFEDLRRLGGALLGQAELQNVASHPEHAEGGVFALVDGIHGADGIVGLLEAALLAEVEYFFYGHWG